MEAFEIEAEGALFTVAIARFEHATTMNDAYILTEIEESQASPSQP